MQLGRLRKDGVGLEIMIGVVLGIAIIVFGGLIIGGGHPSPEPTSTTTTGTTVQP